MPFIYQSPRSDNRDEGFGCYQFNTRVGSGAYTPNYWPDLGISGFSRERRFMNSSPVMVSFL